MYVENNSEEELQRKGRLTRVHMVRKGCVYFSRLNGTGFPLPPFSTNLPLRELQEEFIPHPEPLLFIAAKSQLIKPDSALCPMWVLIRQPKRQVVGPVLSHNLGFTDLNANRDAKVK